MPNSNNGYMVVRGMLRSGRRKIANNTMYILFNERMTIKYDGTVRKVGT